MCFYSSRFHTEITPRNTYYRISLWLKTNSVWMGDKHMIFFNYLHHYKVNYITFFPDKLFSQMSSDIYIFIFTFLCLNYFLLYSQYVPFSTFHILISHLLFFLSPLISTLFFHFLFSVPPSFLCFK